MSMLSSFLKTYTRGPMLRALHRKEKCPVCSALSSPYDAVDFNKSCEEFNGKFLPPANISILYYLCPACEFCFAPEIGRWSFAEFQERIYNKDYLAIDPDYAGARADFSAETLKNMFGADGPTLKHLDFGGGSGRLSQLLGQAGWNSRSYDPFADANTDVGKLGVFDLITSFEVFEHVPDPRKLFREVSSWLVPDGVVILSTLQ
jgi:SAM-dependent methyltransferase